MLVLLKRNSVNLLLKRTLVSVLQRAEAGPSYGSLVELLSFHLTQGEIPDRQKPIGG
jgi:hypothetical protein